MESNRLSGAKIKKFSPADWLSITASVYAARFLNRRAWNASEGAKYAAAAGRRTQQRPAAGAFVDKLAGVGRHGFGLCSAAGWAGNRGVEYHNQHLFGSQPRSTQVPPNGK
jgi:hypothetical protein